MLQKSFQKELNKLAKLNAAYKNQLELVEQRIKKEFGKFPSEVDCDSFIDTFHTGVGNMTVKQINDDMSDRCS